MHHAPPRKVTVATVMAGPGPRSGLADHLAGAPPLDLVIFPEDALTAGGDAMEIEAAVDAGAALAPGAYVVLPLRLREAAGVANAALLLDRAGAVAGIYRKAHPVAARGARTLEDGILPGTAYPVFDCDFGRLGIQICWDMSYPAGWAALARQGAELIAVPSASPQTARPISYALRHRYYVITSTPRDNVSVVNPAGLIEAQRTTPGLLVHPLDLSHAVLHWSPTLDEGLIFTRAFGDRAGYCYSSREDTGVFWSNDPALPIGAMLEALGLETQDAQIARCHRLRRRFLP
jgi:predicted amidohydrolase